MPRHLRCRGCATVLGAVHGNTLRPVDGMRVAIDVSARRVSLTCPACGAIRDWRDGCVLIERQRVIDSRVAIDEAATGRR